jgi:hypothetical protein
LTKFNLQWLLAQNAFYSNAQISVLSGRLLSLIPFEDVSRDFVVLEDLPRQKGYVRPPISEQTFAPEVHEKMGQTAKAATLLAADHCGNAKSAAQSRPSLLKEPRSF